MTIEQLFKEMVDRGASDLHLRVGVPPALRINGDLYRLQADRVSLQFPPGEDSSSGPVSLSWPRRWS